MRIIRKIRYIERKFSRRLVHNISKFEKFCADILYDRKVNNVTKTIALPLLALSKIFKMAVRLRYWLYKKNVFLSQPLGCPIIVIGNLTVGGTGKTPVVEKFARELNERGRRVAILSRGYKSKQESKIRSFFRWLTHAKERPPRVVSNGQRILIGPERAGDEPYMLAKNLPGVVVIVDKDRVKAGRYAIKKYGANLLILDDGFQYLPLRGHMNILLIDQTNPFGNKRLLPRGILREPIDHINRASYVMLTKSNIADDPNIVETIHKYLPNVGIIKCFHGPKFFAEVNNEDHKENVSLVANEKICAFSGIAMPDSFENFLTSNGANLVYKKRFIDHHKFTRDELDHIFTVALYKKAKYVITTEKDAVRIPKDYVCALPTFFLKIEIKILDGAELLDQAITKFITKYD
ncbi:MAG: tetraacyldisaccharide 4'-kinase [Opitutales bacterium]|nr:tetraacyldisaccharide 4'-kinase [Opitutales bacterium]